MTEQSVDVQHCPPHVRAAVEALGRFITAQHDETDARLPAASLAVEELIAVMPPYEPLGYPNAAGGYDVDDLWQEAQAAVGRAADLAADVQGTLRAGRAAAILRAADTPW